MGESEEGMLARCCCRAEEGFDVSMLCDLDRV